jgi:hypothetical protein
MKGALAIAAAEIRTQALVVWGALFFSLVNPMIARWTDGPLPAMGIVSAVVYSIAMAIVLGSSVVARDIGERRLAFYLARPAAPLLYWGAKLAAAGALALTGGLIVLIPPFLLGAFSDAALSRLWLPWLTGLGLVLAGASAVGGAARSRSGLLIVDVLLLPVTGFAIVYAYGRSLRHGTDAVVLQYVRPGLLFAVMLTLAVASAAQVYLGRLDVRRGHAVLSLIAWGGAWIFLVGGITAIDSWVGAVNLTDVLKPWWVSSSASQPPTGSAFFVAGLHARWRGEYVPGFLVHADGSFSRLGGQTSVTGRAWSADGRWFAFFRTTPIPDDRVLRLLGLSPGLWVVDVANRREPVRVPRAWSSTDRLRALSPAGTRALVRSYAAGFAVVDLSSGAIVAQTPDSALWIAETFLTESKVRALRTGPSSAAIVDWDLDQGTVVETGSIAVEGFTRTWYTSTLPTLQPTNRWQQVLRQDASGFHLHALDGKLLRTLSDGWMSKNHMGGPLSQGRIGLLDETSQGVRFRVFDHDGLPLSDFLLEGRFPVFVGGETSPGVLALRTARLQSKTLFVEVATGTIKASEADLHPWLLGWTSTSGEELEPGSLATRLFRSGEDSVSVDPATRVSTHHVRDRGIVLFDPDAGTRRVLIQPRSNEND